MNGARVLRNLFRALIALILGAELAAVFVRSSVTPEFSWELLLVTLALSWGGLELVHRLFKKWYGIEISPLFWLLIIVPVLFDLFGGLFYLFDSVPAYDVFMHFIGGGLTVGTLTLLVISRINKSHAAVLTWPVIYYIAASSALFIGFLYEALEYFFDVFWMTDNLANRWDTTEDMMLNFAGVLTVVAAHYFWRKTKSGFPPSASDAGR